MSVLDRADPNQQFSRKEAAALIGVSVDTIIRYSKTNKLEETRLPSARGTRSYPRFSRRAIEAFLASGYPVCAARAKRGTQREGV